MRLPLLFTLLLTTTIVNAQFLEKQKQLEAFKGYFNFYYSEVNDKIYLEVDTLDTEFLYVHSLTTGLGSNDIGLDRGQIGDGVVVKFKKVGNKLLLIQPNLAYRAITTNQLEQKSVAEAFANSVLFGFPIKETKSEHKFIIDFTPFLLQDTHGIAERLEKKKEGTFTLDTLRSALQMKHTKAFPKNVVFEALTTFKGAPKGKLIQTIAPDSKFLTVTQHHSFVKLPDATYKKREFDPRSGAIFMSYLDYATPIQESIVKRYIIRHRLNKKYPNQEKSEAKDPIVYYLDPGTPEPIKSALLEGASWWNQAFEEIGFTNAFQVKLLPADADPMDVRYNVIQWVHRSTRGWSYGASVIDPRTGEIIKGHVSLGSLRIRQDFLIAQALLNQPFATDSTNNQPMLDMALARIRQLAAHEVGHTLGFAHNFAASAINRASVMDYPHPKVSIKNGEIDISDAYDTKIGVWDKTTVAYSYSEFKDTIDEDKKLKNILEKAYASGLRFITDSDARAEGGAHGLAHLWDNGQNASEELKNILEVRKVAIKNFGINSIRNNESYSVLEDVFVPLYFFHRYQTEAAVKLIGGLNYNYALKGDTQTIVEVIPATTQQEALQQVLHTLSPEVLAVPKDKLHLFPPRAYGFSKSRESFSGKIGVGFDALSVAETASDMTLSLLLNPQRASRMVQQKSLDKEQLGLSDMLDQLISASFDKEKQDIYYRELRFMVSFNVLKHLMNLAVNDEVYPQVRAIVYDKLQKLKVNLSKGKQVNIYSSYLQKEIDQFFKKPTEFKASSSPKIPDGSPIGSFRCDF